MKNLAIVMGRNYTSRLGMIRAAGMTGCDVVVIQTGRCAKTINKIDASSKYVVKCFTALEPDKEKLIELILQFENREQKSILLPTDDFTASAIDLNMNRLKDHFYMPHVCHKQGAITRIMDKSNQKKIAEDSGFYVAKGWVASYRGGKYIIPDNIKYPCFVKPKESFKRPLKHLMKKCCNEEELSVQLKIISEASHDDILIEEYIEIEKEYAVLGLALDGTSFTPDIITMKSSYNGVTAMGIISPISIIPDLDRKIKEFIKKTQLTGLFDIDLYESRGLIYFNELNARFGASGYAVTHAISNLPELFIKYLEGDTINNDSIVKEFKPLTFANEKVCLEKYISRKWPLFNLMNMKKKVDFCFIDVPYDTKPFNVFKIKMARDIMKCFLKHLLRPNR